MTKIEVDLAFAEADAAKLRAALWLILPDLRHSIKCGDGRFTSHQLASAEDALGLQRTHRLLATA